MELHDLPGLLALSGGMVLVGAVATWLSWRSTPGQRRRRRARRRSVA